MKNEQQLTTGLMPLSKFLEEIGKTRATIWRWQKQGWITTVNIGSKLYITSDELERFKRRALAGEFAVEAKVPLPPRAKGSKVA